MAAKHPILGDVPQGYGIVSLVGRDLLHLVKCEAWNRITLCGTAIDQDRIYESMYGRPRPVCAKCVKLHTEIVGKEAKCE